MGHKGSKSKSAAPTPVPTPAPSKPPYVFGVSIREGAQRTDPNGLVPSVVKKCCEFLESKVRDEGIYRIPGSHAKVLEYVNAFENGVDVTFPPTEDSETVASIMIRYLRDLPHELVPPELSQALKLGVEEGRKAIEAMNPAEQATLKVFVRHLYVISINHEVNKMTATNLAICIDPGSPELKAMIENYPTLFENPS